jgi:hypothetical protein
MPAPSDGKRCRATRRCGVCELETTDWVTGELSQPEQAFDKAVYLLIKTRAPRLRRCSSSSLQRLGAHGADAAGPRTLRARRVASRAGPNSGRPTLLTEVLQVQVAAPDDIAYEQRRARRILGNPEPGS